MHNVRENKQKLIKKSLNLQPVRVRAALTRFITCANIGEGSSSCLLLSLPQLTCVACGNQIEDVVAAAAASITLPLLQLHVTAN